MRKWLCTLALLTLSAAPCTLLAAPDGANQKLYANNGFNPGMLDASLSQNQRLQWFSKAIQQANLGQIRAQELTGTLYWKGSKVQDSPVAQNLAQARILLANAAVHGDVPAMAKLAELELGDKHVQQAMIWAQLYAHYLDPTRSPREWHGRMYAYASDLLERIMAAGGKVDSKVSANVNGMAGKFNTSIRSGMEAFRKARRSGNPHLIKGPHRERLKGDDTRLSGVAEFMVAFDPSGKATQAWLLASYPDDAIAKVVRNGIEEARVNPMDSSTGMRYLEVSVHLFGNKEHTLKPHH